MHDARFVDEEPIPGTQTVVRVWDAQHALSRASRSLTELLPEDWDEARERVRVLSRLRHPALPQLVAVGEQEGVLRLVEEWVEGTSLDRRVADDGPLPFDEVRDIMAPVLDALVLAHSIGMAHGGVDAHSILVDQVGSPMLVGMGSHTADLQHDVADLALLLSEVVQAPMPPDLDALIEAAMAEEVTDMAAFSNRFRMLANPEDSDPGTLGKDFDFVHGEASDDDFGDLDVEIAPQSRLPAVLAAIAVGIVVIAGGLAMVLAGGSAEELGVEPMDEELAEAPPSEAEEQVVSVEPEFVPVRGTMGRWEVVDDVAQAARVVLKANNTVEDRNGRSGRPALALTCDEGELLAVLEPGVRRVEAVAEEQTYELYAELEFARKGLSPTAVRADLEHGDSRVYLPSPKDFAKLVDSTDPVSLSFLPFASEKVVATFHGLGAVAALDRLTGCR